LSPFSPTFGDEDKSPLAPFSPSFSLLGEDEMSLEGVSEDISESEELFESSFR